MVPGGQERRTTDFVTSGALLPGDDCQAAMSAGTLSGGIRASVEAAEGPLYLGSKSIASRECHQTACIHGQGNG